MINEKIGNMISELDTAAGMLIVASTKNDEVREAMRKVSKVSFDLGNLIEEIETENAIERCRLRRSQIQDKEEGAGDCGTDENGKCIGYANSGGEPCDECKECIYSVNYEDE